MALEPEKTATTLRQLGRYQLVELIGRGGMAQVWRARIVGPAGFERPVVIKRILPHLAEDPEFAEMFIHEARMSARLSHPNVVQVFELGEFDGEYFIAMEYLRGHDLLRLVRAQMARGTPMDPGLAAAIMRDVCRALAYVHTLTDERGAPLGLVHRDISPSNVMVGFDGVVKLLDFGIAKALSASDQKTRTGVLKGKFSYMSPEQAEGSPLDHRSDLFSA
jgi:serine/threonine protein kinase